MPSQWAHLYDARWRKYSAAYLRLNPDCVPCLRAGRRTPATLVHHKKPHRGDKRLFWYKENWQARCTTCHNDAQGPEKTGRAETYRGCDENGVPLDPGHHWRDG
jgi:5-methylcytosine-specific restriction endonuclease McrA